MSLQVWLPLNGTLENKGLGDLKITQVGTLNYSNSGKIGKSIIFPNNPANYIYLPGLKLQIFSWCCWFKCLGEGSSSSQMVISEGRDYSSTSAYGTNIRITKAGTGLWCTAHKVTSMTFPIELNKWYHFVMVADGSNMKYYLNGELKQIQAYSSDSDYSDSNDAFVLGKMAYGYTQSSVYFPFNGQLNDVRIYDHALSLKEIKEISKGLILHYPLDNNGFGNENLLTGSYDFSGSWVNSNNWTTDSNTYNGFTVKKRSAIWGGIIKNIPASTGDIFTISFWAKIDLGGKLQSVHRSSLGNVTTGLQLLGGNFSSSNIWVNTSQDGTDWKRYWATLKITSDDITYLQWRIQNSVADKYLYIAGIKIEKGDIATPWCPNKNDSMGILLGMNENIIYDTSGYQNNGEIINTITYSSNTPKYSVSTHIGATNQKIHISNFPTSGFGDSYSFAWWGKRSSNTPMFWGFSNSVRLNGMYLGYLWNTGDGSNNPLYYVGTTTQVTPPSTGVWHHYVMTGNGTKCYVYLDGQLWAEAKTYKSISGDSIYINGWDSGTSYCSSDTDISNFRIYATALTAEDIKQLYQVRALGDRNNNFCSTAKFIEEGYSNEIEYFYDFAKGNYAGTFEQKSDGLHLNGNIWVSHSSPYYIPINPSGKTYKFDIVYSNTAGNQFYIGWERYDANKTSRSNQACVYAISNKPTVDHQYTKASAIINLSTDGVNPCAFIKLRILNQWTGSTTGTEGKAIIHSLSLKEYSSSDNFTPVNISKTGIVKSTELIQKVNIDKININRPQQINANNFIQI